MNWVLKLIANQLLEGLIKTILKKNDVYDYIGVHDSLVRERLFVRLSLDRIMLLIYDLWTGKI